MTANPTILYTQALQPEKAEEAESAIFPVWIAYICWLVVLHSLCMWWFGQHKAVYTPFYYRAVQQQKGWQKKEMQMRMEMEQKERDAMSSLAERG